MAKQRNESQRGLQAAPGELPAAMDAPQTHPAVSRSSSLGQLWVTGNEIRRLIVVYHSCPRKIQREGCGSHSQRFPRLPLLRRYLMCSSPGSTRAAWLRSCTLFLTMLFAAGPIRVQLHPQLQGAVLVCHITVWKEARWKDLLRKDFVKKQREMI